MQAHGMPAYQLYYQAAADVESALIDGMRLAGNHLDAFLTENGNNSMQVCDSIQRDGNILPFVSWGSATKVSQVVWEELDCELFYE